jgi:hypothetical protein
VLVVNPRGEVVARHAAATLPTARILDQIRRAQGERPPAGVRDRV